MNASKKFGIAVIEGLKINIKKILKSIKQSFLKVTYGMNSISVQIGFIAKVATKTISDGLNMQVPIRKELLVKV